MADLPHYCVSCDNGCDTYGTVKRENINHLAPDMPRVGSDDGFYFFLCKNCLTKQEIGITPKEIRYRVRLMRAARRAF